jgi:cytochrome c biogenesis protein CcdA
MSSALVFAFTAGMVSTVNPCGFALLPVWFARQLEGKDGERAARRFLRASLNAVAASLGYIAMFTGAAVLLWSGANWLGSILPYVGVGVGIVLVIWGFLALLAIRFPSIALVNRCRRANESYGALGFGLSYGFLSLSCTLPIFMAVAGVSFLDGSEINIQGIVFFLLGSGAVLALLAVAAAMLGSGVFHVIGRQQGVLKRVAGALTALAGGYVFLYWGQVLFDARPWMRAILDTFSLWSARLGQWMSTGAIGPLGGLLALVAIGWASYVVWRRGRA